MIITRRPPHRFRFGVGPAVVRPTTHRSVHFPPPRARSATGQRGPAGLLDGRSRRSGAGRFVGRDASNNKIQFPTGAALAAGSRPVDAFVDMEVDQASERLLRGFPSTFLPSTAEGPR